jgi:F-box domain
MSMNHWKRAGSVKADKDFKNGVKVTYPPKQLIGLAVDILFHVFSFLSPKDIISLRQVSKTEFYDDIHTFNPSFSVAKR